MVLSVRFVTLRRDYRITRRFAIVAVTTDSCSSTPGSARSENRADGDPGRDRTSTRSFSPRKKPTVMPNATFFPFSAPKTPPLTSGKHATSTAAPLEFGQACCGKATSQAQNARHISELQTCTYTIVNIPFDRPCYPTNLRDPEFDAKLTHCQAIASSGRISL